MNRKAIGTVFVIFVLIALAALQAQAQTATPTPRVTPYPEPTVVESPTLTPTLVARSAVVKRTIDGDSIEVVFVDGGQVATIHLANVDAPDSITTAECFGRESAEYAVQAYQDSPLISIELTGEIENGEGTGYVHLIDGTLLNRVIVLFGYARYDDTLQTAYSDQIKEAETQSKQGRTGLWKACGVTGKPPKPCYLFDNSEMDSASKRAVLAQLESVSVVEAGFKYAYYDSVQNEIIATWRLGLDGKWGNVYMHEYYRLPDCTRDRSVVFEK